MIIKGPYARQKKWTESRLMIVGVLGCTIVGTICIFVRLRYLKIYIPDDGFAAEWSYSVASGLVIHKTSAKIHTLCDTNGWGLIDGNILRFAVVGKPTSVIVEYTPFIESGTQKDAVCPRLYGVVSGHIGSNGTRRIIVCENLTTLQSALGYADDMDQVLKPVTDIERRRR